MVMKWPSGLAAISAEAAIAPCAHVPAMPIAAAPMAAVHDLFAISAPRGFEVEPSGERRIFRCLNWLICSIPGCQGKPGQDGDLHELLRCPANIACMSSDMAFRQFAN